MNIALLKKVRDYIAKYPEKYEQGEWCGTRCCIAGHAIVISGAFRRHEISHPADNLYLLFLERLDRPTFMSSGAKILGLTQVQAHRLFAYWPKRFSYEMDSASSMAARSRVAVKRINHFIKTRGAE